MKLVNFSHPLSSDGMSILEGMVGEPVEEVLIPVKIDFDLPVKKQIQAVVRKGLEAKEENSLWIPPALSTAAAVVGEGIGLPAGRMVVIKSVGIPRRFVPAEII